MQTQIAFLESYGETISQEAGIVSPTFHSCLLPNPTHHHCIPFIPVSLKKDERTAFQENHNFPVGVTLCTLSYK